MSSVAPPTTRRRQRFGTHSGAQRRKSLVCIFRHSAGRQRRRRLCRRKLLKSLAKHLETQLRLCCDPSSRQVLSIHPPKTLAQIRRSRCPLSLSTRLPILTATTLEPRVAIAKSAEGHRPRRRSSPRMRRTHRPNTVVSLRSSLVSRQHHPRRIHHPKPGLWHSQQALSAVRHRLGICERNTVSILILADFSHSLHSS